MKNKLLFIIHLLTFIGSASISASPSLQKDKANRLIQDLCEKPSDDDLQWEIFCIKWFKSRNHQQQNNMQFLSEEIMTEPYKIQLQRPRRRGGFRGGGSRSGGFRFSSRASRSSSSGSSFKPSGSRVASSATHFRSTRTGGSISRPTAHHYSYRSSSYSDRYTTPLPHSQSYYHCTSNSNSSNEIQCSAATGDKECCEDEASQQAFCCGGDIDSDLVPDLSKATQLLTRIFYTLTIIALCMHVFMRQSHR